MEKAKNYIILENLLNNRIGISDSKAILFFKKKSLKILFSVPESYIMCFISIIQSLLQTYVIEHKSLYYACYNGMENIYNG